MRRYLPFFSFSINIIIIFVIVILDSYYISTAFIYLIAIYWTYKSLIFGIFSWVGFIKLLKHKNKLIINEEIDNKNIIQAFIIASYNESYSVLQKTVRSISEQKYDLKNIFVFVSFEQRRLEKDVSYSHFGDKLQSDFPELKIFTTVHPSNTEGEVPGAAANKSWAAKFACEIFQTREIDLMEVIATIPDVDTTFENNYCHVLLKEYLKETEISINKNMFFMPKLYKLDRNLSEQTFFVRSFGNALTLGILGTSEFRGKSRYSFSCFSINLKVLSDCNFFDTSQAIDDTFFYWRMYNFFKKKPMCKNLNTSVSVLGVQENNFIQTFKAQYNQIYRWGWGAESMKLGLHSIVFGKSNFLSKFIEIFQLFDRFIFIKLLGAYIFIAFILNTNINNSMWASAVIINLMILPGIVLLKELINISSLKELNLVKLLRNIFIDLQLGILFLEFFAIVPYLHAAIDIALGKKNYQKISWTNKKND